jgi:hypothetical protein
MLVHHVLEGLQGKPFQFGSLGDFCRQFYRTSSSRNPPKVCILPAQPMDLKPTGSELTAWNSKRFPVKAKRERFGYDRPHPVKASSQYTQIHRTRHRVRPLGFQPDLPNASNLGIWMKRRTVRKALNDVNAKRLNTQIFRGPNE